jgi:hypothetical protein
VNLAAGLLAGLLGTDWSAANGTGSAGQLPLDMGWTWIGLSASLPSTSSATHHQQCNH